ncbi:hypothetical protein FLP41_15185 [Paracoccus marcusii]|nr:hypothetical protein FLP41_15185 [Paracoccus marcusii]
MNLSFAMRIARLKTGGIDVKPRSSIYPGIGMSAKSTLSAAISA